MLDGPPCPPELRYVMRWWSELADSRVTGMGLVAITFTEIAAWAELTGREPDPIEVRALRHLDHVLRAAAHESPDDREKAIEQWLTSQL